MVAASAPVTDRRAGPAGTGRGPQQDAGCPERLSPVPPTQAPTHACSGPTRLSTSRYGTAELRGNSFRVFGPVLVLARAPPNRRRNGTPPGAPARSKDPPLCTLGNVVFSRPEGGSWGGRLGARGLVSYGSLSYSRFTAEDHLAQSHCLGEQLLRRLDSWGLWMELEAKNEGERV